MASIACHTCIILYYLHILHCHHIDIIQKCPFIYLLNTNQDNPKLCSYRHIFDKNCIGFRNDEQLKNCELQWSHKFGWYVGIASNDFVWSWRMVEVVMCANQCLNTSSVLVVVGWMKICCRSIVNLNRFKCSKHGCGIMKSRHDRRIDDG